MMRAKAQQEAERKKKETEDAAYGLGKAAVYQVNSSFPWNYGLRDGT